MRNRQSSPENPAELISHLEMKKTLVRLQRRTGAAKKKTQSTGAKSLTRAKYDISSPVRVLKNSKKAIGQVAGHILSTWVTQGRPEAQPMTRQKFTLCIV